MGQLSQLDLVKLDAERITLKRIQEAKEQKAWQESKEGVVSLGDAESAVQAQKEEKPEAVKQKKDK